MIQSADEFPCLKQLLRSWHVVRMDLDNAWRHLHWLDYGADDKSLVRGDWKTAPLYTGNMRSKGRKPKWRPDLDRKTMRAVLKSMRKLPELVPAITRIFGAIPEINFAGLSVLGPASEILPHRHENQGMICHVFLYGPLRQCGLRVGEQRKTWQESGESMVFDSSMEHEAWNIGNSVRSIVHIDFSP